MNTPTPENQEPAPRILIVEDEPGNVANLSHKLKRDIPNVVVNSADNSVDGAKLLIADPYYDAVILDYMLPEQHESKNATGDRILAFVSNPDTLVIHATAWPDDPQFKQMVAEAKSKHPGPRLIVPKVDEPPRYWAQEVVDACARHVDAKDSRRVRAEFERLFGEQKPTGRRHRALNRQDGKLADRAWSLAFVLFCQDAARRWKKLDKETQDLLSRTIGHTTYEGRDVVGVVTQDDNVEDASPEKHS